MVEDEQTPRDDDSFSTENVLLYVCLNENDLNVEHCQKCVELQHIFENKNSERKYLLYKFPLDKLHNPDTHELENIPTWLELFLYSILANKQDMDFCGSIINFDNGIETKYQSKSTYAKLLIKYAKMQPGGHIFFSIVKSKFLEKDLQFFIQNNIINIKDEMRLIGDYEGLSVIGKHDKFGHTFLFGGLMKEVKNNEYGPSVGNVVVSNISFYACGKDQFDILKGTSMKVEQIDSEDGWILIRNTNDGKQQWISFEDFMHFYDY